MKPKSVGSKSDIKNQMTVGGMHIHLESESEKELRIGQKLKQKEGGRD